MVYALKAAARCAKVSAATSAAPSAAPSTSPTNVPSAGASTTPSGVLGSVPLMPSRPTSRRLALSHLRHHPTRRLLLRLCLQSALRQPAHQLRLREYYGQCRRCRCKICRALSHLRHLPARRLLRRLRLCTACRQPTLSQPISYAFGSTLVCAVDAAVKCAERRVSHLRHHTPRRLLRRQRH